MARHCSQLVMSIDSPDPPSSTVRRRRGVKQLSSWPGALGLHACLHSLLPPCVRWSREVLKKQVLTMRVFPLLSLMGWAAFLPMPHPQSTLHTADRPTLPKAIGLCLGPLAASWPAGAEVSASDGPVWPSTVLGSAVFASLASLHSPSSPAHLPCSQAARALGLGKWLFSATPALLPGALTNSCRLRPLSPLMKLP